MSTCVAIVIEDSASSLCTTGALRARAKGSAEEMERRNSQTLLGSIASRMAYMVVAICEHVNVGEGIERDNGAGERASLVCGDAVLDESGRLKLGAFPHKGSNGGLVRACKQQQRRGHAHKVRTRRRERAGAASAGAASAGAASAGAASAGAASAGFEPLHGYGPCP